MILCGSSAAGAFSRFLGDVGFVGHVVRQQGAHPGVGTFGVWGRPELSMDPLKPGIRGIDAHFGSAPCSGCRAPDALAKVAHERAMLSSCEKSSPRGLQLPYS